jgi:predicted amidohydrolase
MPHAFFAYARDVQVIDAAGQFAMPGMMDRHVQRLSSGAPDYASADRQGDDSWHSAGGRVVKGSVCGQTNSAPCSRQKL